MIRFACPGCEATYTVEDAKGGKAGKCPKCQSRFTIPFPEGGAPPPPPLSAPPVDSSAAVEIAPCPGCKAKLSVAAGDLGLDVECPECQTVYTAVRPGGSSASRRALVEEDEDERPVRRGRRDDEDRPSRRRRDDDEEEVRPRRRNEEDDFDEDERPQRKTRVKRRRSGGGEPHRGTLILILGILGFVGCGIFTAIPAWIMGKSDLAKMDQGEMDEEGRSLTQVGMYLGMASCILTVIVFLGYCVFFIIFAAAAGG